METSTQGSGGRGLFPQAGGEKGNSPQDYKALPAAYAYCGSLASSTQASARLALFKAKAHAILPQSL